MLQLLRKDPRVVFATEGMTDYLGVDMSKNSTDRKPSTIRPLCGTNSGYNSHLYYQEVACDECRLAHNEYARENYPLWKDRQRIAAQKYREDHKEELSEQKKLYHQANKEEKNKKCAVYFAKNRDELNAKRRQFRLDNLEREKATSAEWRKHNADKVREVSHRRRALELSVPSEPYTTQQILDLYGTDCHICKEPIDLDAPRINHYKGWERGLHLDHVVPLSRGGSDLIKNIRPAHGRCNIRKQAKLLEEVNIHEV